MRPQSVYRRARTDVVTSMGGYVGRRGTGTQAQVAGVRVCCLLTWVGRLVTSGYTLVMCVLMGVLLSLCHIPERSEGGMILTGTV